MAGWYELTKSSSSQFHFVLKAANGETILNSEMYSSKGGAESGIASVQVNSPSDARYDRRTSTNDKHYFNLKAANNQVIGTSQMYASAQSRETGITSVKTNGPTKDIRDKT